MNTTILTRAGRRLARATPLLLAIGWQAAMGEPSDQGAVEYFINQDPGPGNGTLVEVDDGRFTPQEIADPAISGMRADPDRDGITNDLEFAFGTHPRQASNLMSPQSTIENGRLVFRFRKGSDVKKIFLEFWLTMMRQEVKQSAPTTSMIQSPTSPKHPQPTQGSPVMGMFRGVEGSSLGRNPDASPSRLGKGIEPADAGR